jgi:hypothetical protein
MRQKTRVFLLVIAGLPAFAANFSGKWMIEPPAGRGGRGGPTILVLNQVGNEVTGTVSARGNIGSGSPAYTELFGGKVEGDVISFYAWTGSDEPVKTVYRGVMAPNGEEMKLTITGGRGPNAGFGAPNSGGSGAANSPSAGPGAPTTNPANPQGGAPQQVTARRVK